MLIVFILFGVYYLLSPKLLGKNIAVFGMFGLVLTLVFTPYVMEIIEMWLSADLELDRLRLVMSPVYAVIMAVGSLVIANLLSSRKSCGSNKGIAVVTLLCIALVVASPVLAESRDSTVFDGWMIADTDYFTESEIAALESVEMYVPFSSLMYLDVKVMRYYPLSSAYSAYGMTYFIAKDQGNSMYQKKIDIKEHVQYIFVRDGQYAKKSLVYWDSGISVTIYPTAENTHMFEMNIFPMNTAYSNGFNRLLC